MSAQAQARRFVSEGRWFNQRARINSESRCLRPSGAEAHGCHGQSYGRAPAEDRQPLKNAKYLGAWLGARQVETARPRP